MRQSTIRNLIYCVMLVLLFTGFGYANNTLEVKCVDENGQPVEKAKIIAFGLKTGRTSDEKTNKQGVAFFKKMRDDYYRVWVEAKDYKKELKEFLPMINDNQAKIEFTLKAGDHKAPLYFEDKLIMERADLLYKAGTEAIQQRNFEEAEEKLKESLELYPSQINANNNLAFIYFSTSRVEEAKACYEAVINTAETFRFLEEDPNNIALYDKQIAQTKQLLETMPLQVIAAEVDKAMKAGDFATAVSKLDEMIAMQPDNAGAYFQKSIALTRLKKIDEADAAVDKAIEIDPSQDAFNDLKGQIAKMKEAQATNEIRDALLGIDKLNTSGEYEKALSDLSEMESRIPDKLAGAFWWIKGRAHRGLEQKDETIEAYKNALAKEEDSQNLGIYLDELKNWLMDKNYLDDLLQVYPEVAPTASVNVANGLSAIAGEFVRKGDQGSARTVFEKIIEVDPEYAEAYYELGMNYFYEVKNEEKAKVLLDKYIEIGKDDGHLNNAKNVIAVMASEQ